MATALVTGGTSGIGYAFASELAGRGYDLVLVARDPDRLARAATDLTNRFGCRVEIQRADLAVRADLEPVIARLLDQRRPVELLVNNAGFGLYACLLDPDVASQDEGMAVMCTAVLVLSGAAGRAMKARGRGAIINVSSVSAWIYEGNYSAVKRWVLSFTQALALELAGTGVQATVVCPSWVKTDLHERAGVARPKLPAWVWVAAEDVASTALDAAAKGRVVAIPSRRWRFAVWGLQHLPDGLARHVSREISKSRSKI